MWRQNLSSGYGPYESIFPYHKDTPGIEIPNCHSAIKVEILVRQAYQEKFQV